MGIDAQAISFKAKDGWTLTGDLYQGPAPKSAILISSGTGFPRRFYRHAAAHLATRGAIVLTFDYRGIGGSGAENLARSGIDYPDWGQMDMVAALDALADAARGLPLAHLGHSVGGQFAGFMENHHRIDRHAFVSVGSGYWGVHPPRRWPLEWYFWWGFGSYSLWRHGYIKPVGGWRGAALPPDVFRAWRRWSQRKSYLKPDLDSGRYAHHFDKVTSPICSWIFPDDGIATRAAALDTLAFYPAARKALVMRNPGDVGVGSVGHEGAFKAGREALWDECWDWLVNGDLPDGAQDV